MEQWQIHIFNQCIYTWWAKISKPIIMKNIENEYIKYARRHKLQLCNLTVLHFSAASSRVPKGMWQEIKKKKTLGMQSFHDNKGCRNPLHDQSMFRTKYFHLHFQPHAADPCHDAPFHRHGIPLWSFKIKRIAVCRDLLCVCVTNYHPKIILQLAGGRLQRQTDL